MEMETEKLRELMGDSYDWVPPPIPTGEESKTKISGISTEMETEYHASFIPGRGGGRGRGIRPGPGHHQGHAGGRGRIPKLVEIDGELYPEDVADIIRHANELLAIEKQRGYEREEDDEIKRNWEDFIEMTRGDYPEAALAKKEKEGAKVQRLEQPEFQRKQEDFSKKDETPIAGGSGGGRGRSKIKPSGYLMFLRDVKSKVGDEEPLPIDGLIQKYDDGWKGLDTPEKEDWRNRARRIRERQKNVGADHDFGYGPHHQEAAGGSQQGQAARGGGNWTNIFDEDDDF